MSAVDPVAVEWPKARMWRALGALEALFSDLPDLPDPGYCGLAVTPAGQVEVQVHDDLTAARELAERLDLTGPERATFSNADHFEWSGVVAGQPVYVIACVHAPDEDPDTADRADGAA